jgi:hypothetical protein
MKKFVKVILVAIPALIVAAAVGMTTIGCGDDTTVTPTLDMAVPHDLVTKPADLTTTGD